MIDFEIIKKQNKLTTDNELIYVKPLDQHSFTTYPIKDKSECLKITLDEYLGLRANYYRFNEELTGLEINEE